MDIAMKHAIFAVILSLAAAGTAAAADDSLQGLIQAGKRDAALKMIAAGADVNAAQGDGTTPLHWAVYKIGADLVDGPVQRRCPVALGCIHVGARGNHLERSVPFAGLNQTLQ